MTGLGSYWAGRPFPRNTTWSPYSGTLLVNNAAHIYSTKAFWALWSLQPSSATSQSSLVGLGTVEIDGFDWHS